VRLIALLSWYDEPLPNLAACLVTLREKLGVDHLVALDGRYALYPAEGDVSPASQAAALYAACEQLQMTADVIVPDRAWPGEVEKRTALFAYGLAAAEPGDWFVVMDADQVVAEATVDVKAALAATDLDAADVTFRDKTQAEKVPDGFPDRFVMRILFRAQEIRVVGHHASYVAADGRQVWSADTRHYQVPGLDLAESVLVDHRPQARPLARLLAKNAYYTSRDDAGIEFGFCDRGCGEPATVKFNGRWRIVRESLVGDILTMCAGCEAEQREKDRRRLLYLGVDPGSVNIRGEFYGRAPTR
jgi:hypothetical protein